MTLLIPPCTLFKEWAFLIVLIWLVHLFQSSPALLSFFNGPFWMRIYFFLVMVYQYTIWQECNCSTHMCIFVLCCIFLEEVFHPRISKEFHGHGVNLSTFHCRTADIRNRNILCHECLESMTCFMCQNIDITRCSIEVGEDELRFVFWNLCFITTHFLVWTGNQIPQLIIFHHINEFSCFRTHFMIHIDCCFHQIFRTSLW